MKVKVALVTKIDVIAVDDAGATVTLKLASNPILKDVVVGDNLYLDGESIKVEPVANVDQLAKAARESKQPTPTSGRGSKSAHRAAMKNM